MALKIHIVPQLKDNYSYILHDPKSKITAIIDPAETKPILDFLKKKSYSLDYIFNTHHHWDHTAANKDLKQETSCKVYSSHYDRKRTPAVDKTFNDGETFFLCPLSS